MSEERDRFCKKIGKNDSSIPVPNSPRFRRTGSLKLRNEARIRKIEGTTPPPPPLSPSGTLLRRHRSLQGLVNASDSGYDREDDLDSERSFGSSCNSLCGHSPFAHNGTTYSARNMKYIVHCSPNTGGSEEYLTPTQRANRTIKRLRQMLAEAQSELIEKDNEIGHLTKELVELRLLKARTVEEDEELEMPVPVTNRFMDVVQEESVLDDGSVESNVVVEEVDRLKMGEQNRMEGTNNAADINTAIIHNRGGVSPRHSQTSPSLADSGHFEELNAAVERELEKQRQRYDDMREKHNEKVEQLLKIIAESNDKYYDLKPKYDSTLLRIRELEMEISMLMKKKDFEGRLMEDAATQSELREKEEEIPQAVIKVASSTMPENESQDLTQQLQATKRQLDNVKVMYKAIADLNEKKVNNDAETTLQFLKSAFYHFLTDQSKAKDHIVAIESILGYSEAEKSNIEKSHYWKYY